MIDTESAGKSNAQDGVPTRRLFFAITLDQNAQAAVSDLSQRVQKAAHFTPARPVWVPPNNFHLTLYFLGDVALTAIPALTEGLLAAARGVPPFEIDIRNADFFPQDQKAPPKVLVTTVHKPPTELTLLRNACADVIRKAGLEVPTQTFTPHITLARIKSTKGLFPFRKMLYDYRFWKSGTSRVTSVVLMESITGDGPAVYQPFCTAPLANCTD